MSADNRSRTRRVRHALLALCCVVVGAACAADANERNNAGNALAARQEFDQAVVAYQVAQVLAPDRPEAYFNAGIALAQADRLEAALAAVQQALRTADEALIGDTYYNLGNVYYGLRRYNDAVAAYQQVLLRDPADDEARYNLELALRFAVPPTPTAQQQRTEPDEQQTDPETTPTDQPKSDSGPTPTPPRIDDTPDLTATPERGGGDFSQQAESTLVPQQQGRMSVEEALRVLDAIEQQSISEFLRETQPDGDSLEKDW